ncbi:crossveinless d [Carabus blaptoides fortunei]
MKHFASFVLVLCLQYGYSVSKTSTIGEQRLYGFYISTTAGSNLSTAYEAEWGLVGKLLIQSFDNYLIMKVNELKTRAYNGLRYDKPDLHDGHPIPKESQQVLYEPFVVYYSNNFNNLESLKFSPRDTTWSANIKKAIASVFQVNFSKELSQKSNVLAVSTDVTNGITKHSYEEKNIYGKCKVHYDNFHINEEHITITKKINHNECNQSFEKYATDGPIGEFSGITTRYYTFNRTESNDSFIPLYTITSETILTYVRNLDDRTTQEIKQIQQFFYLGPWPAHDYSDLSIYKETKSPEFEVINNRKVQHTSQQTLLNRWKRYFEMFRKKSQRKVSTNINKEDFNIIDNMYEALYSMDIDSFNNAYTFATSQDDKQMLRIFSSLLSYVGSTNSLEFIKLHPDIRTLGTFPFSVKSPNKYMLQEMEKLFESDIITDDKVKSILILSFANLLAKLHSTRTNSLTDAELQNYAHKYFKLFLATEARGARINYLLGIGNMGYSNGLTTMTLASIALNSTECHDLRVLAINVLKSQENFEAPRMYELFWPSVRNTSETLEFRVSALSLILESNQPIQKLYNIMNYVNQGLDDPSERHIHNYYYSMIQSGKSDCKNCTIKRYAKEILQKLTPPASNKGLMTGYYQIQYTDNTENFGLSAVAHVIANPLTNFVNVYQISFNWFNSYAKSHDFSIYVKAEGISKKFIKEYHEKHFPVQDLFKILTESKIPMKTDDEDDHLNIEIIIYYLGKAIYTLQLNEQNADEIEKIINDTISFLANNDILLMEKYSRVSYVSDIGTPINVEYSQSQLLSTAFKNVDKIFLDKGDKHDDENYITAGIRSVWNSKLNFISNNPITNTNIAISKKYSNQKLLKLRIEYSVYELYIKWKDDYSYLDILIDSKHALYVDKDDDLKKTCPKCDSFLFLSGPNKTDDKDINIALGVKNINIKTTNCTNAHFSIKEVINKMKVNNVRYPLIQPIVILLGTYDYLYYLPPYDACSVLLKTKPALTEPTESQVKLNFNNDLFDDTFKLNLDFNVELTLIHRRLKDNKTLNQWNLNVLRQENSKGGHYELHFNDNAKTFKFDIHSNIEHVPTLLNRDMFSLWPAEPIKSESSIRYKESNRILTDINVTTLFTVTDDKTVNKSKNYETCKKEFEQVYGRNKKKLKHVPPTKSCHAASLEMATYDNYLFNINFKNVTKKLKDLIESGLSYINKGPEENALIKKNNFTVMISYYTYNSTLNVSADEKEILANYLVPEVIRPRALLKSTNKLFEEIKYDVYGLESTCIITPYYINTFTEQNVQYDMTNAILPLIECHNNTRLGLITRSNEKMDFKLWADTDIFVLRSRQKDKYSITVNNKPYKKSHRDDDYKIEQYLNHGK